MIFPARSREFLSDDLFLLPLTQPVPAFPKADAHERWRSRQVVKAEVCKTAIAGSIPASASIVDCEKVGTDPFVPCQGSFADERIFGRILISDAEAEESGTVEAG